MARKETPLHRKWRPRVEGQIRHMIHCHPDWFNMAHPSARASLVRSLAKRIVGEIVADAREVSADPARVTRSCAPPG